LKVSETKKNLGVKLPDIHHSLKISQRKEGESPDRGGQRKIKKFKY